MVIQLTSTNGTVTLPTPLSTLPTICGLCKKKKKCKPIIYLCSKAFPLKTQPFLYSTNAALPQCWVPHLKHPLCFTHFVSFHLRSEGDRRGHVSFYHQSEGALISDPSNLTDEQNNRALNVRWLNTSLHLWPLALPSMHCLTNRQFPNQNESHSVIQFRWLPAVPHHWTLLLPRVHICPSTLFSLSVVCVCEGQRWNEKEWC